MEKFAIGLLMGSVIGAVCVTNNYKIRTLVKKGQLEMQEKLDAVMDKAIDAQDDQQPSKTEKTEKPKKSRAKKTAEA